MKLKRIFIAALVVIIMLMGCTLPTAASSMEIQKTVARSDYCFIGKYPNSTKYGVFHKNQELAHFDLGEELIFYGLGGIALGESSHRAYAFFYVSSPKFKVKIIDLGVENVQAVSNPSIYNGMMHSIEEIYPKLIGDTRLEWVKAEPGVYKPGFPTIHMPQGKTYYVIPQKKDWLRLNCLPDSESVWGWGFDSISVTLF